MPENPETIRERLRRYRDLHALALDVDPEAARAVEQLIVEAERQLSGSDRRLDQHSDDLS